MYTPTLEQVEKLASQGNLVPVYRQINADLETPVSAYLKIARPPYSFLLESVEGGERIARYSFIGTEPRDVLKTGPGQQLGAIDPLIPVERELARYKVAPVADLGRFNGGAVGYVSYDAARYFEPRLPVPDPDPLGLPESIFMLTTTFLIFDHLRHSIRVVSHAHIDGDVERAYSEAVERIEQIVARLVGKLSGADSPSVFGEGLSLIGELVRLKGSPEHVLDRARRIASDRGAPAGELDEFAGVADACLSRGVPDELVHLDLGLARGISYYTGVVFTLSYALEDGVALLGSGGRYDGLVRALGGPEDVPALGYAYNLEEVVALQSRLAAVTQP